MVAEQRFDDLYKEVTNLRTELATLTRDDGVDVPVSNCLQKIEEITKKNEEVIIAVKTTFVTADKKIKDLEEALKQSSERSSQALAEQAQPVSYTHLTLPTKRIV